MTENEFPIDLPVLPEESRNMLFADAHTVSNFSDKPVSEQLLHKIYETLKYGPTSMNCQPLRLVFLTSAESKERLLPLISANNMAKTSSAPVTAILAADADFNLNMPILFPHAPDAKNAFGDLTARKRSAGLNAALQIGYAIIAIRSFGLAAGPMGGFDRAAVDAEFFAGTNINSQVLINIGYPGTNPWHKRLPRLAFEQVAQIL